MPPIDLPSLVAAIKENERGGLTDATHELGYLLGQGAGGEQLEALHSALSGVRVSTADGVARRDLLLELLTAAATQRRIATRADLQALVALKGPLEQVLATLQDGRVKRASVIADDLGGESERSKVSRALDELEEAGLVETLPAIEGAPKNARNVRLTLKGERTLHERVVAQPAPSPPRVHGASSGDRLVRLASAMVGFSPELAAALAQELASEHVSGFTTGFEPAAPPVTISDPLAADAPELLSAEVDEFLASTVVSPVPAREPASAGAPAAHAASARPGVTYKISSRADEPVTTPAARAARPPTRGRPKQR